MRQNLAIGTLFGVLGSLLASAAPAPQSGTDYTCDGTTGWHDAYQTVTCQGGTVCQTGASGNPCVWPSDAGVGAVVAATTGVTSAAAAAITSSAASVVVTGATSVAGTTSEGGATTAAGTSNVAATAATSVASAVTTAAGTAVASSSGSDTASGTATASAASSSSSGDATNGAGKRYVAYWSNYANLGSVPSADQLKGVTHLILAFADMTTWSEFVVSTNGNFDAGQISTIRSTVPGIKVMVALGGWGLDTPIKTAADGGDSTIATFVQSAAAFVKQYDLDGVDIDWEYPTASEDSALISLAAAFKKALGDDKLVSLALPARVDYNSAGGDAAAYTSDVFSKLGDSIDMYNLMSYDYINRYDTKTGHQAGGAVVTTMMKYYQAQNIPMDKSNIGFPMYAKWFVIPDNDTATCTSNPIGCTMGDYETNGEDNHNSGWLTFNSALDDTYTAPKRTSSWNNRPTDGSTEYSDADASAWYDSDQKVFWTWLEADDIKNTCNDWKSKVGGMMVWSLNQDTNGASGGEHLAALADCLGS